MRSRNPSTPRPCSQGNAGCNSSNAIFYFFPWSMQRNEAGETPAEVLRGRIRRLCEAEGVPFEDLPPEEFADDRGRPLSVASVLRKRV
jgi:hypothetical protein